MTIKRKGEPRVRPTSPATFIREDILEEFDLTQEELAKALRVSRRTVNQLVNGKRGVSAEMALRLGRLTCTTAEFWLNAQRGVDLWDARRELEAELALIEPLPGLKPRRKAA
jgi:addiction module HigA family antidote